VHPEETRGAGPTSTVVSLVFVDHPLDQDQARHRGRVRLLVLLLKGRVLLGLVNACFDDGLFAGRVEAACPSVVDFKAGVLGRSHGRRQFDLCSVVFGGRGLQGW
jgi:hypothetical protein